MYMLANLINIVFVIMYWLIFIRVLISWIRPKVRDPFVYKLIKLVYDLTEPVLEPIRRLIPTGAGIDFSPFVALILLNIVKGILIDILL